MIRQHHVRHQLAAYVDGQLSQAEAAGVRAHLETCDACRAAFDDFAFTSGLLERLTLVSPPNDVWRSIEAALEPASQPAVVQKRRLRFTRAPLAAAAAIFLVATAALVYRLNVRPSHTAWDVTRSDRHRVERLAANEWLQTGAHSPVRLSVGTIGTVVVAPNSRIRLLAARPDEYRLDLARGEIAAVINAPPRLFFVETPVSTVVDLGCAYTMRVDDESGGGLLRVTGGWASLEWDGRESLVPAGASCRTRAGAGPGIPSFDDATPALRAAVQAFDFENGGTAALETILKESRARDTLTLWHLLSRVAPADRIRVFDRMVALVPLPQEVDREKALALDRDALKLWREELAWSW